jgi:hypothetical protein
LKASFYSDLRQEIPPPPAEPIAPDSYCHFGSWCDEVYFKQLTGEQLEDVKYRGRTVTQRWVKIRENHFHDCRIGNIALAEYLGIAATTPDQWAALAVARGLPPELSEASLFTPRAAAPALDAHQAQAAIAERKRAEKSEPPAKQWLDGYEVKF